MIEFRVVHRAWIDPTVEKLHGCTVINDTTYTADIYLRDVINTSMLARDFGDDESMQVCHETIYQALYVQTRGNSRVSLAEKLQPEAEEVGSPERGSIQEQLLKGSAHDSRPVGRGRRPGRSRTLDAPDEYKTYLHRAGRTGRVVTLITRQRRRRMSEMLDHAEINAPFEEARPGDDLIDELAGAPTRADLEA